MYVTTERNELTRSHTLHKVVSKEYRIPNIYENFGGGELSPGKIEFGVVVVRFFVVMLSKKGCPFLPKKDRPIFGQLFWITHFLSRGEI